MHRIAIAFFYDPQGWVDEYFTFLLTSLRPHVAKIILVSGGPLSKRSEESISSVADELLIGTTQGFDVLAYKAAIEHIGFPSIMTYDEALLLDHTFYGPIFSFTEMFEEMEGRSCDLWGITAHKGINTSTLGDDDGVPCHLDSHFIAIRRSVTKSQAFRFYWENIPPIADLSDEAHRCRFTKFFTDLGYIASAYIDPERYGSQDPAFMDVDETLRSRSPVLARRLFLDDPLCGELGGSDLPRALRIVAENSQYDLGLVWRNIVRLAEPRVLNTNAALLRILPDVRQKRAGERCLGRIAVCAHVYYVEMLDEIIAYLDNIRGKYDLIVTTDTLAKKEKIEQLCGNMLGVDKLIVRVVEQNRGRDISALFITCRDLFLDDSYALVCRIHTKKTLHVEKARANIFKHHMFENLLNSEGYVENVLDLFDENPFLGLAIPPIVNISHLTLGHSWFSNRERAREVATKLRLAVPFDKDTPVAPYGTMFWFRPRALRKLFEYRWDWADFNAEPNHFDGSLAHALERLIAYVAHDAQYITFHIASAHIAEQNYVMLEWKLQALLACFPNGSVKESSRLFLDSAARFELSQARLTDAEARRTETEARLAEAEARRAETEARLADAEARRTETEARLAEAEARLTNTLASHSWRVTAPLRSISRMIYRRS